MTRRRTWAAVAVTFVACASCGKKDKADGAATAAPSAATAAPSAATAAPSAATAAPGAATAAPGAATAANAWVPAGSPPPDGKYERVVVEGVTVPMIHVMNGGTVVLVDTDGKKPRDWEEQYKKKRDLPAGQLDVHKTNTNKNDTFEDDPIDKEGLWVIDAKGNITKH
jgi:hypothetical protein